MKMYLKNGMKLLANYGVSLVLFLIFLYPFMGFTKNNLYTWLPIYSAVFFIFAYLLIYSDMKALAIKEKKPQYDLKPYPLKGALYGIIGVIPISVIVVIGSLIRFNDTVADRILHIIVNIVLGPLYFLYGINGPLHETAAVYAASILLLVLTAMLGYLAGFYGINILAKVFRKKNVTPEKTFTKSPWNPSNTAKKGSGKKKRKTNE